MSEPSPPVAPFPTTHWTAIHRAGTDDGELGRLALSGLLKRYLPALRAHLLYQRRLPPDLADDLLQGFITSRILERNLLAQADPQRGRFRTLLLTALKHYLVNHHRDAQRSKRRPEGAEPVSLEACGDVVDEAAEASEMFDRAWANEVIQQALQRMERELKASDRVDLWRLFQGRVVQPAMEGAEPVGYEDLIRQYGFQTPIQAANALVTAKRMFARILRAIVAEYARDGAETEEELRELKAILAAARRIEPAAV